MINTEFRFKLIELNEPLLSFASKLTSDRDEALDLVQDTFLKALNNSEKFIPGTNLKAWTYTILKNIFINNYRRQIRQQTINSFSSDGFFMNNIQSSYSENPEFIYNSKELELAIESLNIENRLPFRMYSAGFKYKEIASKLKLNIGTVKSRIFFTRRKLVQKLNS